MFGLRQDLSPEALRAFQAQRAADSYVLVDVRQPEEYAQRRLPGGRLLPLPDLNARVGELDRRRATVVYCRTGHRSHAAAQFLVNRGFQEVYDLRGGLVAWDGATAFGPLEWGLDLVPADTSPAAAAAVALTLEQGLEQLYRTLQGQSAEGPVAALFGQLAEVEARHVSQVQALAAHYPDHAAEGRALVAQVGDRLEGGFSAETLLRRTASLVSDPDLALQLAMTIEAQGWDLYLRYAARAERPETRTLWHGLAADEQQHLRWLGDLVAARVAEAPTGG